MSQDTLYPAPSPGDLNKLLSKLVSLETEAKVVHALKAAGILGSGVLPNVEVINSPDPTEQINNRSTKVVVLGSDSSTNVQSNHPILIAASSGKNYIDISSSNNMPNDTVIGGSGNDTIFGNGGKSVLIGGSGHEKIASGGGRDTLIGGSGTDTLLGGGQSVILAGPGADTIKAGRFEGSQDTVFAGSGQDKIFLTQGNNVVQGPSMLGKATITAGSGHDTIYGGRGAETVIGGAQTTINLGSGHTTLNLNKSANDTIYGGANTGTLSLNKASTDATITPVQGTDHTTITFASGGSITTVGNVKIEFNDHTKTTVS